MQETPWFWACEVADGDYIWPPYIEEDLPPFNHNALHEIESLLWMSLWALLYFVPDGTTLDVTSRDRLKALFEQHFPPPGPFPCRTQFLCAPRKIFVCAKKHGIDDRVLDVLSPYTKVFHRLYTLYSEIEKMLGEGKRDGPAIPVEQFEIHEVYLTIIEQCKGIRDVVLAKGLGKAISWADLPVREQEAARINLNKMNITAVDAGLSSSRITRSALKSLRVMGMV
ncbi:hypothetical protein AAF712_005203 [Marasmius tenuissimus]|uniref:Uncharacterized protein n=1 Tax=Marasmius tenuissimus TaxID=585030 RepID=A0ABR3A2F4_9AGAR